MQTSQEYYTGVGSMTALGSHATEYKKLPKDLGSMCEVVQGVLIHRDIAPWLYNITLTEEQREDGHIRPIEKMLTRIHDHRSARRRSSPAQRLPAFLADALFHVARQWNSGTTAMRVRSVLHAR
jgi:hypothetical protein